MIYEVNKAGLWKPDKVEDYEELQRWIASVGQRSKSEWADVLRWYCKNDLFYLLNFVLTDGGMVHSQTGKLFHYHQHYLDSCRQTEWQIESGSGLDCSSRGDGKSTVRSKCAPIQIALNYPEISIFIFSVEKQLAIKHLRRIKNELHSNQLLKTLFDDILWENPKEETREVELLWSATEGITLKRKMVRSTATIEVHALFGGGPVGTRPDMLIMDDIETSQHVSTAENVQKLKAAFSEAISLVTPVVIPRSIVLISNTRFSRAGLVQSKYDQYKEQDEKKVRCFAGEDLSIPGDGPLGGTAVYPFTTEMLWMRYNEVEIKEEYGLQIALTFNRASATSLSSALLKYYDESPERIGKKLNVYICIDASRGVYDPTSIFVWGIAKISEKEYRRYWLDGVTRKMDPSKQEFHDEIERVILKWQKVSRKVVEIRVDQIGNQAWAELIRNEIHRRGIRDVPVIPCKSIGKSSVLRGMMGAFSPGKNDRIYQRWSPALNRGEIYFPKNGIHSRSDDGQPINLVNYFVSQEMEMFPGCKHDDMLDAGSLLEDDGANKENPLQWSPFIDKEETNDRMKKNLAWWRKPGTTFMSG